MPGDLNYDEYTFYQQEYYHNHTDKARQRRETAGEKKTVNSGGSDYPYLTVARSKNAL